MRVNIICATRKYRPGVREVSTEEGQDLIKSGIAIISKDEVPQTDYKTKGKNHGRPRRLRSNLSGGR